jgi:hypothetical protein
MIPNLGTLQTQHLSLSTFGASLPSGEFPSKTTQPVLHCQMRPPQPETCDKFAVTLVHKQYFSLLAPAKHISFLHNQHPSWSTRIFILHY